MGGEVAVGDRGADAQAAVRCQLDLAERQFSYVDEPGRPLDARLHQVDEVGAAAQTACVGVGVEQGDRGGHVEDALVAELLHATASVPAARATALTIET